MTLTVYLSGEIHTHWRDEIIDGATSKNLDIEFTSAVTEQVVDILQYVTR